MSFFEDLKNTKVSDVAFYLIFVMAQIAPGTSYAMYFFLDIFKELDGWKAVFMIIAFSSPMTFLAILFTYLGNMQGFSYEERLKPMAFYSCIVAVSSSYLALMVSSTLNWGFELTAGVAAMGIMVLSFIAGFCSRFD